MNYDLEKKIFHYYNSPRNEMIKYAPSKAKRFLDVGCGEGIFGNLLKQKFNAEIWGIEINDRSAEIARKKIDKVLKGDIVKLLNDIPKSYFDCIYFNDVLEHIVNPFYVLKNIKNNLRKDGVIVCSIPNVRYFFNLYNLLIKKQWVYEDEGILDKTHLRFFTKKSILNMFKDLGYTVLEIEGIRPIISWEFDLLNCLFLGYFSDTRYLQYACIAKPNNK